MSGDVTQERDGRLVKVGDREGVRFVRRLGHSPERVWRAITDSKERTSWFPAEIEGDLTKAGSELRFPAREGALEAETDSGSVTDSDPPRLLAYRWGEQSLRFELEPDGDGCRLTFTHLLPRDETAKVAAGWQLCLDSLEQLLGGEAIVEFDADHWSGLHDRYAEEFGVDLEVGRQALEERLRTMEDTG